MLEMKRQKRGLVRGQVTLCIGLVLSFLMPPLVAIAQDAPRRSGPPPKVIHEFPNVCARCHKADGRGGPAYGGFAADLRVTLLTHEELVTIITDGRRDRGMPAFKGVIGKRQIDAIATFIEKNFKGQPIEEK